VDLKGAQQKACLDPFTTKRLQFRELAVIEINFSSHSLRDNHRRAHHPFNRTTYNFGGEIGKCRMVVGDRSHPAIGLLAI